MYSYSPGRGCRETTAPRIPIWDSEAHISSPTTPPFAKENIDI